MVRDQLAADLAAAWGGSLTVIFGNVPVEPEALPYAAVVLEGVDMEFRTVRSLSQNWRVSVFGVFARPPAGVLPLDFLVERFDALSTRLEASELYAGVAMLPHTSQFEPEPAFDVREGVVALSARLSFATEQPWGS